MKIAILHITYGLIERGSEVFVKELSDSLAAKGFEIDVYSLGKGKSRSGVKNIKINMPKLPGRKLVRKIFPTIYDILKVLVFSLLCLPYLLKNKYDWVIPVNGYFQVLIAGLIRKLKGAKILITGHAGIGRDDKFNIIIGKPDIFVTPTKRALVWTKKVRKKQRVVYIPHGIELNPAGIPPPGFSLDLKPPVVLCVSALLPYKRVELVIRALSRLPQFSLLLVGDGPLREKIQAELKEKLPKRSRLILHIDHKYMHHIYKSADIFSLPSQESEAFGIVYLEAMRANIPVVAPLDEARKEIVGNAGILCRVEDEDEYSKALKKASKIKWHDQPYVQAKKFDLKKIIKQYEALFIS